ncbi:hypothetical protein L4D06_03020 [Enterovibrio makurazakiensis]|uniref:hypothetical protein n=1 Tax=Enterovibrio makurazakiensis TaxID=2910232 RepID=UPI003D1B231F
MNSFLPSNNAVGFVRIFLSFVLLISPLNTSANTDIERVLDATEALNDNTVNILADAERNTEEFGAILNKMDEVEQQTDSALTAIRSGNFGKLTLLALDNAKLGELYVAEYQTFLKHVGQDSSCYRPHVIGEFNESIAKLKAYAARVPQLQAVSSEEDALLSIIELNLKSGSFFAVPAMFHVTTLCIVGDAEPILEQFNAMEGDVVAGFLAQAMQGNGFENGDIPPLSDDMIEMLEEEDAWEAIPSRPISDIQFSDPNVEICVKDSAEMFGAEMTDELPEVICDFPEGEPVALEDLAKFQALEHVTIEGAKISSLSSLSGLPYLNSVVIENSVLSSVANLSDMGGSLVLSNTEVIGWSDLAQSGFDTVNIEQLKDCKSLSAFLKNDSLIITFVGTGEFETLGDIDGNGMRVVTDCTKDSVF